MVGDYISREAALAFPFANGQYDHENADPHFINGCESYREWLETIPAADVVEVRHGRWREAMGASGVVRMACTNCGFYRFPENDVREPMFNYCPRCGAKMDGGQEDGV